MYQKSFTACRVLVRACVLDTVHDLPFVSIHFMFAEEEGFCEFY